MTNNETSIIISAVDKTQGALNSVNGNLSKLEGQFTKLTGVVSGFAALAGVTAFAGVIKGAIDGAGALHDMSQQTGATVESLSAMRGVAKIAGVEMDQVAGGLTKLSKNMLDASNGTGDALKVFNALGISVTDTNGRLKSSDAVMLEFSKSLQSVSSHTEKAAAAQLVFGKSGAALMPLINDLSSLSELQAKITTTQAAAADELGDTMIKLQTIHKAWVTTVAMEIVPAANAFADALLESAKAADGTKAAAQRLAADGSISDWATTAARAAALVVDEMRLIGKIAVEIGTPIERLGRNIWNLGQLAGIATSSGSFAEKQSAYNQLEKESKAVFAGLDKRLSENRADSPLFSDLLEQKIANIGKAAEQSKQDTISLRKELEKIEVSNLLDKISGKKAGLDSSYWKELNTLHSAYSSGTLTLNQYQKAVGQLTESQQFAKSAMGGYGKATGDVAKALENLHITQMARITKEAEEELSALAKAQEDYGKAVGALIIPLEQQAYQFERQVEFYGLTESAVQSIIVTRLEEARALAAGNGAWQTHLDFLDQEITARKRIATASSRLEFLDANKKAAEDTAKYWEKVANDVDRTLGDALMRGFEAGKGGIDNFLDSVRNSLKTAGLKILVNYAVDGTGNLVGALGNAAINSALGTSGSNGGSGTNYLGVASNVNSLYNAYNSAAGYYAAYQSGTALTAAESSAAAAAYYQSGYYGTGAALQAGSYLGAGSSATAAASANTAASLEAYYAANGLSTAAMGSTVAAEGAGSLAGSLSGLSSTGYGAIIAAVILFLKLASQQKTRYLGSSVSGSYVDGKFGGNLVDEFKKTSSLFSQGSRSVELTPISNNPADFEPLRQAYIDSATRWWNQAKDQAALPTESDGAPEAFGSTLLPADPAVALTQFDEMVASSIGKTSGIKTALDFLYESVKGGLIHAGETLWDTSFTEKLKGFTKDIQISNISDFKASLEAVGTSLGESMSAITLPAITELKKSGETWSQSFGRLMIEANAVARVADLMGKSLKDVFGENNANGILRFSDSLVSAFGDIDKLNQSFGSYYANFYTQEEQQASARKDMTKAFEALNQTMPTTRLGFRALVDAALAAGDATLYKKLLDLQGGFAALTPAISAAATAIDAAGRKTWGDKLAILDGSITARQQELNNALAGTTDDEVKRLISDVFRLEDAASAAAKAADTLTKANTEAAEKSARAAEVIRAATLASFDTSRAGIRSYADAGLQNITKIVDIERQRIGVVRSVAAESVTSIKSVFSLLNGQVTSLYASVSSTADGQSNSGAEYISNALRNAKTSGYLPDRDALSSAISAARAGLDPNNFASQVDADRAALVMAGELSQLKDISGQQLPAAEQAVKLADDQLKALDDSLAYYKKQLDQLLGINDNTLNLSGTIEDVGNEIIARLAGMTSTLSTSIIAALKGGSITSADAAGQLKASGTPTDVAAKVGSSNTFVSSKGAAIVDGMVYATNGFKGSMTAAKDEVLKAFNTLPPRDFQAAAISVGLSAAMIDQMFSLPAGQSNRWALENGLPAFAVGTNYVPRDMIAQIHEGEAIIPKAYNPALSNNNSRLEKLVEGLAAELQRLQVLVGDGNLYASRQVDLLDRVSEGGNAMRTEIMNTVTVA